MELFKNALKILKKPIKYGVKYIHEQVPKVTIK
jgi:hypothetical protein